MDRLKILLLFPNTSNEGVAPLAVSILSAISKRYGHDIRYFETSFYKKTMTAGEERERTGEFKPVDRDRAIELIPHDRMFSDFKELLSSFMPDILAVTANSLEYDRFCLLFEKAGNIGVKPFIIVGGVHATIAPDDVISNTYIDAICIGEGEKGWEEFLVSFKQRKPLTEIKNIWVKIGSKIYKTPQRPLLTEDELWLEELDESFFDNRHYLKPFDGKLYNRGMVELSRGCPYRCSYCVNTTFQSISKGLGKFVRIRPLESVKQRILDLKNRGMEMFQFQDECFLSVPGDRLAQLCKWYGDVIRLPVLIQTRPESVIERKIELIANMSVPVQISLGVESGSERVLRDICNRRTTPEMIRNAFSIIHKYKIRSNAYTMIGLPTETRDEVFETINLIRDIQPDISIMSVFYPFRGVPLWKISVERGYIDGTEKTSTFAGLSVLKNQPMSPEQIQGLRRTYRLYTKLPREYFPQIELCEKDYKNNRELFDRLVDLSWAGD